MVLLFDGCDLLDVAGPTEALLTADRLRRRGGGPGLVELRPIAVDDRAITVPGGLGLTAPTTAAAPLDPPPEPGAVLLVPGMVDIELALADPALIAAVARLAATVTVTASVCTGAFLLAAAGLLRGQPATTHHEDLAALAARDDVGRAVPDRRWVVGSGVVTAGGLASGLDLGLHLVERLADRDLAVRTAAQLEYLWDPTGRRVHPGPAARRGPATTRR